MYRHGDVLIVPVCGIPKDAKPCKKDKGRVVLAYGEVTGHAHAIEADAVKEAIAELLETAQGDEYLSLKLEAPLTHEEHDTILLPAGTYKIVHQREQSVTEGIRRVAD